MDQTLIVENNEAIANQALKLDPLEKILPHNQDFPKSSQ